MSLSECLKCGGHIPLGPDASNVCEECGAGVFALPVDLDHMVSFIDVQIKANASAAIRSPDHATWSRGVVEGLAIVKRYIEERRIIAI